MNCSILTAVCALATSAEPPMVQGEVAVQAYAVEEETLRAAWLEAQACAEELGLAADDRPELRLVTQAELQSSLLTESLGVYSHQFEDSQTAEAQLGAFADSQSRILLAKYLWDEDAILVPSGNIEEFAEGLELTELCQPAALRTLLVHELVHAADQRRYSFSEVLAGLENWEQVRAYTAVIEGHAQEQARRLCTDRGWLEGFELFSSAIGSLPKSLDEDPGAKLLVQMMSSVMETSYRQGEAFITAVRSEAGAEGVRRAFLTPPSETTEIYEPGWFLHPETRPESLHDMDAGLDVVAARHSEEEWTHARVSLDSAQIRVGLTGVPPEVATQAQASLRECRVLVLTPKAPPDRMITAVVYSFSSPGDARKFTDVNESVLRNKDELLKEGTIRVMESSYDAVQKAGFEGIYCTKKLSVAGQEQHMWILTGSLGSLSVELAHVQERTDETILIPLALDVFRAADILAREQKDEQAEEAPGER